MTKRSRHLNYRSQTLSDRQSTFPPITTIGFPFVPFTGATRSTLRGTSQPGYLEWLKQQAPEVLWDESGHKPNLSSKEDWIAAGRIVFNTPIYYTTHRIASMEDVRDPKWYQTTGVPVAKDGTVPFVRYVIRKKGEVELGDFACGFCHTRVMPDGSVLEGAQGNFPFEKSKAWYFGKRLANPDDARKADADLRRLDHSLFAAPWLKPDPRRQSTT